MLSRPQIPPNYYGMRLSICLILALLVGCFFLGYDGLVHRDRLAVLGVQQGSDRVSHYALSQTRVADIPVPDMQSQDVMFANADADLKSPEPAKVAVKPRAAAQ